MSGWPQGLFLRRSFLDQLVGSERDGLRGSLLLEFWFSPAPNLAVLALDVSLPCLIDRLSGNGFDANKAEAINHVSAGLKHFGYGGYEQGF